MPSNISRYEQDRRRIINDVARQAAQQSMQNHLAIERISKQASLALHEQQLHGFLTKSVVADVVDTVTTARQMAGDDELLKAVAGSLVQAYIDRSQQRLDSFGL